MNDGVLIVNSGYTLSPSLIIPVLQPESHRKRGYGKCWNIIVTSCVLLNLGIDVSGVFQLDEIEVENNFHDVEVAEEWVKQVRRALIVIYFEC